MAKLVTVASGLKPNEDGSHRVALWDVHPDHPPMDPNDPDSAHEAYVAGPAPVRVALTPRVAGALRDGTLVEVDSEGDPKDRPSAAVREAVGEPEPEPSRPGRR